MTQLRQWELAALLAGSVIVGVGCATRSADLPLTDEAVLKTPTKQILVTTGDVSQPYDILGEVTATAVGQTEAVKDVLRNVAVTKYGERVDAIIKFKSDFSISRKHPREWGGRRTFAAGFRARTTHMEGIAVSFKGQPAPAPRKPAVPH